MSAPINMPTRSEPQRKSEFGVGCSPPRRSIFGNYKLDDTSVALTPSLSPVEREKQGKHVDNYSARGVGSARDDVPPLPAGEGWGEGEPLAVNTATLQSSIDAALARTFIYRQLAKAYEDPEAEGWQWLSSQPIKSALQSAVQSLAPTPPAAFVRAAAELADRLTPDAFDDFHYTFVACFGHTVRGDCPMNEIEYGDIKADPLFQPHRLADLGAFYAAFGLEMTPDAAERQDHISIELEFMSVLAAKEAYALEHQLDDEHAAVCREAQKKFLREHLGRWTPAFSRRLARMACGTALGALADFTREFITEDCTRFKVTRAHLTCFQGL